MSRMTVLLTHPKVVPSSILMAARMLELLVASVTLYEDKMDIEVRTEGLTCAMEEIENESDQD